MSDLRDLRISVAQRFELVLKLLMRRLHDPAIEQSFHYQYMPLVVLLDLGYFLCMFLVGSVFLPHKFIHIIW